MKCPKCAYLTIDTGGRCKNCGYEFSLIDGAAPAGLTPAPPSARPRATPLNLPSPTPKADLPRARSAGPTPGRGGEPDPLSRPFARPGDGGLLDLPLFDVDRHQNAPLPPPHRPLAVRRAGGPAARPRPTPARPVEASLPLEADADTPVARPPETRPPAASPMPTPAAARRQEPAGFWRRLAAALVDACALVLVDLVTLYFTLGVAGLEPAEWRVLPLLPLLGFFAVINLGYVVLLTAALGQTLGKMALQLEVVADDDVPPGIGKATVRTLAALGSLAPAGLGLAWAFFGDRRALHDRLAQTRVVFVGPA